MVVDGGTRRAAAIRAGIEPFVVAMSFPDEDAALLYAVQSQANRRNLTAAELLNAIRTVDKIKAKGGDRKSEKSIMSRDIIDPTSTSAAETAEIVGVSEATVNRARVVLKDEEATEAVMQGKASINMGARMAKTNRRTSQGSSSASLPPAVEAPSEPAEPIASAPIVPEPSVVPADLVPTDAVVLAATEVAPASEAVSSKPRYDSRQYEIDARIYAMRSPFPRIRNTSRSTRPLGGNGSQTMPFSSTPVWVALSGFMIAFHHQRWSRFWSRASAPSRIWSMVNSTDPSGLASHMARTAFHQSPQSAMIRLRWSMADGPHA